MYTQTITRRTIKRVENRLNGVGSLGFFDPISATMLLSAASGSGSFDFQAVVDWLLGRTGQLKVTATKFAESMVKVMYGLEPDCALPPPGIPIVPGNPEPKFCSGSIAGMIERCRLTDAQNTLNGVKDQFAEKTRKNAQGAYVFEEGQYVARWLSDYGNNDFSNLATKITAARATCGIGGGGTTVTPTPVPKPGGGFTCPQNYRYNPTMERCDYVLPGIETGMSSNTMLIMAAVAMAFIFAMKR
jgi:hypothetical protein